MTPTLISLVSFSCAVMERLDRGRKACFWFENATAFWKIRATTKGARNFMVLLALQLSYSLGKWLLPKNVSKPASREFKRRLLVVWLLLSSRRWHLFRLKMGWCHSRSLEFKRLKNSTLWEFVWSESSESRIKSRINGHSVSLVKVVGTSCNMFFDSIDRSSIFFFRSSSSSFPTRIAWWESSNLLLRVPISYLS